MKCRINIQSRLQAIYLSIAMLCSTVVHADITADTSLGTSVVKVGNIYGIFDGTQVNSNLFHSFDVFDVSSGETASFQGPAGIENILGRVTGGNVSSINGTLQSTISGANLYLINPAGVIFGADAALDLQGSFHVATADYVVLGSDGRFDASVPGNSVLTMSAPSAFGFVNTAAPITFNNSFLRTPDFATLSVIGGDITLTDATLHSMEGRIDIASVASAGEVESTLNNLDTSSFTTLGDIRITDSTNLSDRPRADNFGVELGNIDVSGDGAGDIYIRSGSFYSDNGQVFSDTQKNGAAGKIDIEVRNELKQINEGRITADVFFGGAGGDINVDTGRLILEDGSIIRTQTLKSGDAGNVVINANESIFISGRSSSVDPRLQGNDRAGIGSETSGNGGGAGGRVEINTPILVLSDEAKLSTDTSNGQGGELLVNTKSVSISDRGEISLSAFRAGNGGSLLLNTEDLTISNGGAINSISFGAGNGGAIVINATDNVKMSGVDPTDTTRHSRISTSNFSLGNGGTIEINAAQVQLGDRALIEATIINQPLLGQPEVAVDTRAGTIAINADSMNITGGAQVVSGNESIGVGGKVNVNITNTLSIAGEAVDGSASSGLFNIAVSEGDAGNLQVSAAELVLEDRATINTSTIASGRAGQINIDVTNLNMESGAVISSTTTSSGNGGEVVINASSNINASGRSAKGFATGVYSDVEIAMGSNAAAASGDGGSIQISSAAMTLSEGATVSAKSVGSGNAGSIDIDAGVSLVMSDDASITTKSTLSGGGKINLVARDLIQLSSSRITSSVADGSGSGGDITIDPIFVILNSSQILANADAGNGGNIQITAQNLIASSDSIIDASANTGIDGEINISSPDSDLSGSLTDLPQSFLNVVALLKQRCAARSGGAQSSFVVTGSGGVPATPGGLLYASSTVVDQNSVIADSRARIAKAVRNNAPALQLSCKS